MFDIHTHVLPGLDDGPADASTAIDLLRKAQAWGTTVVVATPHLIPGAYDNTRGRVLPAWQYLVTACRRAGLSLDVLPGCEAMIHPKLLDLYDRGELPTLGDHGTHLLLEFPLHSWPWGWEDVFFGLQERGLRLIVAHPERYEPVQKQPQLIRSWLSQGVLVQVNGHHLVHGSGPVGQTARRLLESGCVHVIASDAHSERRPPDLGRILDTLGDRYGPRLVDQCLENAAAVATGQAGALPPLPAAQPRRRAWIQWLSR